MLEGWYCRSLANETSSSNKAEREILETDDDELQAKSSAVISEATPSTAAAGATSSSDSIGSANPEIDYKERYRNLKKKLKFLIYENEYFQDLLHTNQRRLLKVSRDRSFLIDRLLIYEKPAKDSSDSDATDSSNSDAEATTSGVQVQNAAETSKEILAMRRKPKEKGDMKAIPPAATQTGVVGGATRGRRRKIVTSGVVQQPPSKKQMMTTATVSPSLPPIPQEQQLTTAAPGARDGSGSLSTAEITRQLQERRPTPIELMSPECASATVPATMLSDESPSKIYPNESLQHLMEEDSASHVAAEECVPMVYTT